MGQWETRSGPEGVDNDTRETKEKKGTRRKQ